MAWKMIVEKDGKLEMLEHRNYLVTDLESKGYIIRRTCILSDEEEKVAKAYGIDIKQKADETTKENSITENNKKIIETYSYESLISSLKAHHARIAPYNWDDYTFEFKVEDGKVVGADLVLLNTSEDKTKFKI